MENAITAGLSRQIVLARALEVTANNIANQTTAGFKADRAAFREYLASVPVNRTQTDINDPFVSLVVDRGSYTDFSGGALEPTYNAFDFAIDGDAFFAVDANEGVRYTRDGGFSINAFGELVTREGARVLDDSGAPILLNPEAGEPVATTLGELQQDGVPVARIGLFSFENPAALRKTGGNLFSAELSTEQPIVDRTARLRQGFLETSNVAPITAVTDMIEISRAYQQAAQVVETADELARDAFNTLAERT